MRTIDKYFKQNVIGISGVEFLWGLGLPVVFESTFLQLFVKELGASSFQIGLIPSLLFIGSSIFAFFSSYITSNLTFKRRAVILLHLVSGLCLLFFGMFLFIFGDNSAVLAVFFISYGVFSVCVGMTLPVWLNYLVNILSPDRSVSGLGFMMLAQNAAKLVSGLFIIKWVEAYAFSFQASSYIFMAVGLLFALGSLFFLVTREIPSVETPDSLHRDPFRRYVRLLVTHIFKNKNFLLFLAADSDYFVVVAVISFYATYATTFCGVEPAIAAGAFVTCIYIGAIVVTIFLGSLDMLSLRNKYVFSKVSSMTAMGILILSEYQWGFLFASLLIGAARGTRPIVFAPTVKRLSGLEDATSYFAVAPILTMVFASCLPLLYGKFLDHFNGWNGDAYRIVFLISALLILFTLYCLLKVDYREHQAPGIRGLKDSGELH